MAFNYDKSSNLVYLHIYDMSKGLAKKISKAMIGKQIDGIWHTGTVVYGREFFFGDCGIQQCDPGGTVLGSPDFVEELGPTSMEFQTLLKKLHEMSADEFSGSKYRLFNYNCNTFSNRLCQLLVNKPIPNHIVDLPNDILATPFGQILKPIIDSVTSVKTTNSNDNNDVPGPSNVSKNNSLFQFNPLLSIEIPLKHYLDSIDYFKSKYDDGKFMLLEETFNFVSAKEPLDFSIGRFHIRFLISAIEDELDEYKPGIACLLNCLKNTDVLEATISDPKMPLNNLFNFSEKISMKWKLIILINMTSTLLTRNVLLKNHSRLCVNCVVKTLLENDEKENTFLAVKLSCNLINSNENYDVSLEIGSAIVHVIVSKADQIHFWNDSDCGHLLTALDMCIDQCEAVGELGNTSDVGNVIEKIAEIKSSNESIYETCQLLLAKLLSLK